VTMNTLLLTTIALPMAGALWIWTAKDSGKIAFRQSAFVSAAITLVLSAILIANYQPGTEAYAATSIPWLGVHSPIDVQFSVGLDGLSLWLFGLTSLLMITAVLVGWEAIDDRAGLYYGLLLMLETGMLGVFAARDIILFYIFFEFTLIPLFLLIGIWGSEDRRYAAIKFFLFTLAGSLLTFLGLLTIVLCDYGQSGHMTFSIPELTANLASHPINFQLQLYIFLALFAGFAIKVPLFPLHTWLPLAHTQAPAAGSVLLAGVLLKIGSYGFARFSLPMLPDATAACVPWVLWLSVIGIIYGALVALVQTDMKRLIAYSSVSHLGFCMLGLFALNTLSVQGSVLQMINHGLSTGGLFAVVGMIYERYHTREIAKLGGLARRVPVLTCFMLLFTFSSIGLPGLNGFAGEFPILQGMFARAWNGAPPAIESHLKVISVLAVLGVVLGAWYMLWLIERVFFGPLREPGGDHAQPHHAQPAHVQPDHAQPAPVQPAHAHGSHGHAVEVSSSGHGSAVRDLSFRELMALAPLAVFIFWIGLHPDFFMRRMAPSVDELSRPVAQRFEQSYETRVPTVPPQAAERSVADGTLREAAAANSREPAALFPPKAFIAPATIDQPAATDQPSGPIRAAGEVAHVD
jgi:NADH-quinone oxidoreductase subunit M